MEILFYVVACVISLCLALSSIFPYSVCKQNMVATALAAAVLWQLLQCQGSFAAIRLDGSVVTWGIPRSGGDSADVQDQLLGPVSNGNVLHMNHEKPAVDKDVGTKLLDLLMYFPTGFQRLS